jgi:hypothetical protein
MDTIRGWRSFSSLSVSERMLVSGNRVPSEKSLPCTSLYPLHSLRLAQPRDGACFGLVLRDTLAAVSGSRFYRSSNATWLDDLVAGRANKQIAYELGISSRTIDGRKPLPSRAHGPDRRDS